MNSYDQYGRLIGLAYSSSSGIKPDPIPGQTQSLTTVPIATQITDGIAVSVSDVNKDADANRDGLLEQTERNIYNQLSV